MHVHKLIDNADNVSIADALDAVADELEARVDGDDDGASLPFRVRAWRRAADEVRRLDQPVVRIAQAEGIAGLDRIPHVGPGIARAIDELIRTGHLGFLDRYEDEHPRQPQHHDDDAHGHHGRPHAPAAHAARQPSAATLLAVDADYRARAAAGTLKQIAPARFNPTHAAWLPILHDKRDGFRFTALFSNTALAHELKKTNDWVVIYFEPLEHDGHGERQCTVVTETRGAHRGRRVIRGREDECP